MKLEGIDGPYLVARKTWPDGLSPTIVAAFPDGSRYIYILDNTRTAERIWQIGRRWPGRAVAMLKELVQVGTAEVKKQ